MTEETLTICTKEHPDQGADKHPDMQYDGTTGYCGANRYYCPNCGLKFTL